MVPTISVIVCGLLLYHILKTHQNVPDLVFGSPYISFVPLPIKLLSQIRFLWGYMYTILGCEVSESVLTPSRYFGAVFQHIHGVCTGYNMVFFMNLFTREDDTMIELVDSEKLGPPQLDL